MILMILMDIKMYVKQLKENFKKRIEKLNSPPQLAIIQMGNTEASNRYISNKIKDCEEIGIIAHHYWFDNTITEKQLLQEIVDISMYYNGVIVQLPLPPHIRQQAVVAAIPADKDVDGFRTDSPFDPATPKGIMDYLKACNYNLEGQDIVIIGRSDIVGKPLAKMMTDANATVTLCHSKSKLSKHIYNCDLIITAVGKPKFLNCYSIYVPVIDVGINFDDNGKLCGDCFNTEGRNVTPVPGGVGLLTRCALLDNVITARENRQ